MASYKTAGYTTLPPAPASVVGAEGRAIVTWVGQAFESLTKRLNAPNESRYDTIHLEPEKPREGQVVYADGTNWNPGQGSGLYTFNGTSWDKNTLSAADILTKLKTVDGAGSGLDADTVDGLHAATGSYIPTLTAVANVDATTSAVTYYVRVGNIVIVFGGIEVDATAAASTVTQVGQSLPVASNFTGGNQLRGVAVNSVSKAEVDIFADTTNDRANWYYLSQTTANVGFSYIFGYVVL